LGEGDWVGIDYALLEAAAASGMSQYELLTRLGTRYTRYWT
jgi:alanine racemase